jgi:hypothetical protein
MIIASLTAARILRSRGDTDRLLVLYWLATMLPLVGLAKAGSNHNHWTEFAASTAVLATLGLWHIFRAGGQLRARLIPPSFILPLLVLAATLLAVVPLLGGAGRLRPAWPQPDPGELEQTQALVERVRSERGAVLAAPLDLLALADRPILLEPYIFSILEREERWDAGPLVRRICAREVGLLVFEHPLKRGSGRYHGYDFWPAPVVAALQDTMVLEREEAGYFLYVPRPIGTRSTIEPQPQVCPD